VTRLAPAQESAPRTGARLEPWPASRFPRLRNLDVFVAFNTLLFVLMCGFSYYDRFLQYRGPANVTEFFLYSIAILLAIAFLWLHFRRYPLPWWLLGLIQTAIVIHYAGAFVELEGRRLYDNAFFGLRYDKYVHFTNAFLIAVLISRLLLPRYLRKDAIFRCNILLAVLGLGAVVEIIEYVVCKTIPRNGVGDYDNNLQDLIANLLGGSSWLLLSYVRQRYLISAFPRLRKALDS
jgi:uncharacterized membrane protein YjdF